MNFPRPSPSFLAASSLAVAFFQATFAASSGSPAMPSPSSPVAPSIAPTARVLVTDHGAVADGATINTAAIQALIDRLASSGGGTVVVPPGVFVSGALDLRPGVHLHLEKGAVLRAVSRDIPAHFPARPTRIEGQLRDFTPALLNAERCDGLRITGEGVLDGAGRPVWDEFWARRKADKERAISTSPAPASPSSASPATSSSRA